MMLSTMPNAHKQSAFLWQVEDCVAETVAPAWSLVSLFAGAGGLDLGFEQAGFHTVWANEFDKVIAPTYQKHFAHTQFDGRSIRDIPDVDIPRATGVIGGPPCQSWSEAGARRGMDDPRGQLFFEYIRVIRHVRPLFFVAENVSGILHKNNKNAFENIIKLFKAEGYEISWRLLNASDYGVPQDRQRVVIVGYHHTLNKRFDFPAPFDQKISLKETIGDLENLPIGEANRTIKNHDISTTGFSPIFMSRNRVRAWHEQSYTILACDRHIPLHPRAPKMVADTHPDKKKFVPGFEHQYRRFSIRECARIQTFPDDFEFIYKHIRDGYKMIGNAVPVQLAKVIAQQIKQDLETLHG